MSTQAHHIWTCTTICFISLDIFMRWRFTLPAVMVTPWLHWWGIRLLYGLLKCVGIWKAAALQWANLFCAEGGKIIKLSVLSYFGPNLPKLELWKSLCTCNKWEILDTILKAVAIDRVTEALWLWCNVLYNSSFQLCLGGRTLFYFIVRIPIWFTAELVPLLSVRCSKRGFIFPYVSCSDSSFCW